MNLRSTLLAAIAFGAVLYGCATPAQAQGGRGYAPARPTFSPYFGYFQINRTPIPNYYAYVKPTYQYQDYLAGERAIASRAIIEQNEKLASRFGGDRDYAERRLNVRAATGIGAPSVPGTYQDLSHFYNVIKPPKR